MVPLLHGPVIRMAAPLGLRTGALTASLFLFGPCLFCLGCVSPLLVRLAASAMDRLGCTVGRLYAVSTLGSFVGTVLTGFVLIAYLGVRGVFLLTGTALAALATAYFVLYRRSIGDHGRGRRIPRRLWRRWRRRRGLRVTCTPDGRRGLGMILSGSPFFLLSVPFCSFWVSPILLWGVRLTGLMNDS